MAAIGGIDDELILEPAEYEKHRRAAVRRKWVTTAAACLLFLSAAVLSVFGAKDHRWVGEDTNSEQSDPDREKAAYHKTPGTADTPMAAPPIVYVKDTTYKMEYYYPSANLPAKAVFLGRILLHDSSLSPKENFQSNFEPVGKAVYALGDDILLANDEGYAVYCEIRSNSAPQKEDRSIGPVLSALLALTAVFGITWLLKGKHKIKCRGRL